MRKRLAIVATVLSLVAAPLLAADEAPGGARDLFLKHKCNECHTISTQNVALGGKPEAKPEDLSTIGAKRSGAWIKNFLLKKEAIEGRKHKKKFTGTPAELAQIADWLGAMH
jgi:mono/diheme cytochrome c family protein